MEINPELLQKFFENKCSSGECEAAMDYLSRVPGAREKFFPSEEWEEIGSQRVLPEEISAEMLENLKKQLFPSSQRSGGTLLNFKKRAAAAAILIPLAGLVLILHQKQVKNIVSNKVLAVPAKSIMPRPLWIERVNNNDKSVTIKLPDSSIVDLHRHSVLKYPSAFGINRRDVYLTGEACFHVTKHSNRPFTVFTGKLQTCVLGTTFEVSAFKDKVDVRLFTGKVVVRSGGWKEDVYLSPGEHLSYNKLRGKLTVSDFKLRPAKPLHQFVSSQELIFNNTSLKKVIDKLSERYHRTIDYTEQELTDMNFTGTISPADSLDVILRLIAVMNDLKVQEVGNKFTISKSAK